MSKEHLEEDLSDMWAAIYLMMDLQVREYAISVAGRLSDKNPAAYVFPALRRHLIQLLTFLGQSADSKCREESAKLLGYLIRSCERLILPYKLLHFVYLCLYVQGGFAMREYIPELMPRIVEALLDGAAATKCEVAVATLGQVVQSTAQVQSAKLARTSW
ncbi:serine/threonine-protein kinase TOR-like isoform X2 [Rutidosis leptorrhynchoides]|uniref:serine/threonine-protein kinase TOR-like isoform X2 n=1 Tax=Rutidosis leptorrhynchoides TaxID=125765 RepID=UPI003A993E02